MNRNYFSRRDFIKSTAALTGTAALVPSCSSICKRGTKLTAVDKVTLGKTGLKPSRLGIGTGTFNGRTQRALGTDGFNRLIRYAYDQGVTYIDTAENYQTHPFVRDAIKGIPREKLFIQSKMPGIPDNPLETLDRYRRELGVEYIDSLLIHVATRADWDVERERLVDALEEAKAKKIILSHGVSCHSLVALERAATLDWVDVNLVQINPLGANLNTPGVSNRPKSDISHVSANVEQLKIMRKNGHGIIGMKIIGEGSFTNIEDRKKSINFAMQNNLTDAIVIGFKSAAEIDEAIMHMNNALAEMAQKEASAVLV